LWLKAAYLVSDQLVAVSDFVIRRVPPTPKLCRIYDALDLHLPMGLHAKPRPGSRDVVQIANYISDKGHEHVLNAFVRVAHKHPHSRLVFYGGDMGLQKNRAFRASLEERAAMSGFGERIEFHGFARDVTAALESASVVCNFSKSEALSFTCIEAGQLGLPVVAFRSGGPEEIIVDGETGFLCDIGDIDCAAARIDHLLAHPDEAVAMGRAAVDHVSRTFGNDSFVAAMRNALAI
jgi:glycosyltransferase involved in cell wall biosynthesis